MLGIFDSHPVQYRAPIYSALERLMPGRFRVFYGTDISLRGNKDKGFGQRISWDQSLLEGYPCTILRQLDRDSLRGMNSLHGRGLAAVFERHHFSAVLQTQFLYRYDLSVLVHARTRGLPVWIRQETQDEAFPRTAWKSLIRSAAYRFLYSQVEHAFAIGELNRKHLLRHGIPEERISMARYCTPDRFENLTTSQIQTIGLEKRRSLEIGPTELVIGFFGKLIPKKNPELVFRATRILSERLKRKVRILIVGSGELEVMLRDQASSIFQKGIECTFTGFVNQSEISAHYAATDIMILPSRRMGETWGLVVNEALQAGCSVAISDAAGCKIEFAQLPHCRVFAENNPESLAGAVVSLISDPPSDRTWARSFMEDYSTAAAASAIAKKISAAVT